MYGLQDYLVGLSQLHELTSADERRAVWRQGMTALAKAADSRQPTPLEGQPPDALLASVRAALSAGLVDEMGWLSRAEAAAAVLELATALPPGQEKRALGRRVLKTLHEGDAQTFATLARALALGSPRALAGAPVRARVALALRLPLATVRSADGLALALLCRPELEQEWLAGPSTGVLPARRLAARILERAAREAVRRAQEGDDSGVRAFDRPTVKAAWARLLADRESLVWRHVAVARGFLAVLDPARMEEVQRSLSPQFGPTEWRRAATSLAAGLAHDPEVALLRCRDLARGEICRRHPGVAVGLVHGAARAGEEEPAAAEELLTSLMQVGDLDVMEALAEFRREQRGGEIGLAAARLAVGRLRSVATPGDDGVAALREAIIDDLSAAGGVSPHGLGHQLAGGLQAFADGRGVRPFADAALDGARTALAALEGKGDHSGEERRRIFRALRELDLGLLEDATLNELLVVSGAEQASEELTKIIVPLGQWLLAREGQPLSGGTLPHPVARQRRLRALLHLLDGESGGREAPPAARELRLSAFRLLLGRVEADVASPLRRTLCASLARAGDALYRDELSEMSDLLVAVAGQVRAPSDVQILGEASMVPDVKELYRATAELARANAAGASERAVLDAFTALARALPPGTSPRVEGLRRALLETARALEGVVGALALVDLAVEGGSLQQLEPAVQYAAQLCAGARRRLGLGPAGPMPTAGARLRALDAAVARAVREEDDDVSEPLQAAIEAVQVDLPVTLAQVVARALTRLLELPRERSPDAVFSPVQNSTSVARQPLPQWLPPSRTIGGFYIVRPIGNGAGGSVFVARRAEERHEQTAESYALKVPSYNGQNAHTLSEEEFLQLFREEAGALLTLPQQENLAGFVTFDARARPKPILVMELVHGPTLERIIEKQELSVPTAFAVLRGIATGLGTMHATGVGHLDVKPGNIILRDSTGNFGSKLSALDAAAPVPVLVDFGLAGRKLRPGCASPYYGAPEVWDSHSYRLAQNAMAAPTGADVYAYCCMAYEMLTGQTLFDGESLPALIGNHLSHDGRPPRLAWMYSDPRLVELAEILSAGLVPDPRARPPILDVGEALHQFAPNVEDRAWPLQNL